MALMQRNELELPAPREISESCKAIKISHPVNSANILVLSTYSQAQPQASGFAIDYQLVMDACRIMTNGKGSDPHLVNEQDKSRVPDDTLALASGNYIYHLNVHLPSETPTDYEVVTEFEAWEFPETLPPRWDRLQKPQEVKDQLQQNFLQAPQSAMSAWVKADDVRCVITKYRYWTENAHLIPKDQKDWFDAYHMEDYGFGSPSTGVNNVSNGLTLRADIHTGFDLHHFVICPADSKCKIHMIANNSDFADLLHWRNVTLPDRVPIEFLYARFAYTIISTFPNRSKVLVRSAKVAPKVQVFKAFRLKAEKDVNKVENIDVDEDDQDELSDPENMPVPESVEKLLKSKESFADLEQRWKDKFTDRYPEFAEESEDPPEKWNDAHAETPKMLRLVSKYMHENPQVWQSSTTPPESVRWDKEGYALKKMDIATDKKWAQTDPHSLDE